MKQQMEVIQTAFEYVERLYPAVISCAEKIRTGQVGEAYEMIGEISEGLDWVIDAWKLTEEVHHVDMTPLINVIKELMEALENEDSVLIADLLEYEITDQIEVWYEALRVILSEKGDSENAN